MSNQNQPEQQPLPLTPEKAQQIGVALQRYNEIGASAIINPRNDAELQGLKNFFTQVMIEHGAEFMGTWMAVRAEYEPLVQVIERIAMRIQSISAARAAQHAAALKAAQPAVTEQPTEGESGNIISLDRIQKS